MRCFITTDHPNAGPFTRYPRIYAWLMSKKYRNERLTTFKNADKVISATNLPVWTARSRSTSSPR